MWNFEKKSLRRVLQASTNEYAPFPILMPTYGRPYKAKLELSGMMKYKKHVHIVCLKRSQFESYCKVWPDHTFFILPDSAESLGIGASRWWIAKLAQKICSDLQCRMIYMGDDSVYGFGGLTLPDDPQPVHHVLSYKRQPRYKRNFISLFDMMKHFEKMKANDLRKVAAIGFKRKGQKPVSKKAYERRHIVSAGFFNVDKLNLDGCCFNPKIWAMEDLDFNLRVSGVTRTIDSNGIYDNFGKDGALVVRCNRYLQYKVNFKSGGCVAQTQTETSDNIPEAMKQSSILDLLVENGFKREKLENWANRYPNAFKELTDQAPTLSQKPKESDVSHQAR
jgi:hypothetical protein